MNQAAPDTQAEDDLPEVYRFLEEDDLLRLIDLCDEFFNESELREFATFSPERLMALFRDALGSTTTKVIVFAPEGQVEGFIAFSLQAHYTYEPMALGFLFYVTPAYRKSPAGRDLQEIAIVYAKACGAVAFYNGVMAGIDSVSKTMPNLYMKLGFEPLWWGRKIL